MTKKQAQEIWDGKVKQCADEWRAEHGTNILSETGASADFAVKAHLAYQTMDGDVRETLDPHGIKWLSRDFTRQVEAAL